MNPSAFKPTSVRELIGPVARLGAQLAAKVAALNPRTDTFKLMLCGAPGIGKSRLTAILAAMLAGGERNAPFCVEKISGAKLNAETVGAWHDGRGLGTLFGDWKIKVIEEADKVPSVAQVLMLDYLDSITPGTAILATSNKLTEEITERFHTRFQFREIEAPTTDEIAALLSRRWPELRKTEVNMIAVGCGGNVRAALLDAETALDERLAVAA